jgi:hypothetical protein
MTQTAMAQISKRLLAHLHLTAKQAAVVVDERAPTIRLVVYIYDKQASARVRSLDEWCGYPVKVIKNVQVSVH